jgi:threonine/homoserine/homoserine lactone efflux protein
MGDAVLPVWGFVAVALPLVLTPGASTAVVLRNSVRGGVLGGLQTALGANAASLCLGLLCAGGFAFVLQEWPRGWFVVRVGGALYLTWLGVQSVRRAVRLEKTGAGASSFTTAPAHRSFGRNFRQGFVTNTTNPALATFYFVILPQFIPRGAPIGRAALVLTAVHVALALSWHAAWSVAGSSLAHVLSSGRPRQALEAAAGLALIGLALAIVF